MSKIAIIGCGIQGTALAERLLAAGHAVTVHDRLEAQTEKARELGARVVLDAATAVDGADVTLLVLPAGGTALTVVADPEVTAHFGAGHLVVQMGTVSPADTLKIHALVARAGGAMVECVLAAPIVAILEGTCPLIYGGPESLRGRLAELFANVGELVPAGGVGKAAAFNAATLAQAYASLHGFAIGCAMAERSGLPMGAWLAFSGNTFALLGKVLPAFVYPAHFEPRAYPLVGPVQVKNDCAYDETRMVAELAGSLGVSRSLLDAVHRAHRAAFETASGSDWTSVFDELAPARRAAYEAAARGPDAGATASRPALDAGALRVRHAMNPRAARVHPTTSMREAAELMVVTQASDLMVTERDGTFVGVLSEGDVIRAVMPDFDEVAQARGSIADAAVLFLDQARRLSDEPIARLIIHGAYTLSPDDSLLKAGVLMIEKAIRRLPVLDGALFVGSVSRADLCWALMLQTSLAGALRGGEGVAP